jgi:hypothetical protein
VPIIAVPLNIFLLVLLVAVAAKKSVGIRASTFIPFVFFSFFFFLLPLLDALQRAHSYDFS